MSASKSAPSRQTWSSTSTSVSAPPGSVHCAAALIASQFSKWPISSEIADVVGVRGPGVATRVGGAVLGWNAYGADVARRSESGLYRMCPKPLAMRGGHRPALARRQVGHVDPEPGGGVVHVDPDPVARAHQQVLRPGPGSPRRSWVVERAGEQRVGRRLGLAVLGDVGPVDRLLADQDVVVAGSRCSVARRCSGRQMRLSIVMAAHYCVALQPNPSNCGIYPGA